MKICYKFFYVLLMFVILIFPFNENIFDNGIMINNVYAEEEDNSTLLTSLTVEGYENNFTPVFVGSTEEYTVKVDLTANSITLNGTLADENSTVLGLGTIDLTGIDEKDARVIVTSNTGTRTYLLHIKKAAVLSHSTLLKKLYFTNDPYLFNYDKTVNNYNVQISDLVVDLPITALAYDDDAEVSVTGNTYNTVKSNNSGTITVRVTAPSVAQKTYTINWTKLTLSMEERTYGYSGTYQTFEAPYTGNYLIQLWGAQGGHDTPEADYPGGTGGYTSGIIKLNAHEVLYVYVGEKPIGKGSAGGWNGGGTSTYDGAGAGGATDIRLVAGAWNDSTSLASRIMVAAGGGGGYGKYSNAAGGLTGRYSNTSQSGGPGTQTAGGAKGTSSRGSGTNGGFGYGGNGGYCATGGGGGYYGGGGGIIMSNGAGGGVGAGGSSYISGYTGCVAISAANDLTPKSVNGVQCADGTTNTECSYHYSGKVFTEPVMAAGDEYMPTYDGTSTMKGNEGGGYAKITYIPELEHDNFLISLTSNIGTMTPTFDPANLTYYLDLDAYQSTFTLSGTKSSESAVVTGFNTYTIDAGETRRINVIVIAEDGETQTYKVVATREELNTASTKLQSLTLTDGYTLNFEPLVTSYNVDIAINEMELNINAVPFDENAEVEIRNNEYLVNNTGNVSVVVTNGELEPTTYTITYHKILRDTSLDVYTMGYNYTGSVQTFIAPYSSYYRIKLWGAAGSADAYGAYTEGVIKLLKNTELYVYVGNSTTGATNTTVFNAGTSDNGGYNGGGATDVRLYQGSGWNDFESLKTRIMVAAGGGAGTTPGAAGGLEGYSGSGSQGGTQTGTPVSSVTPSSFGIANGSCTGGNGYFPGDGSACENGAGGGSSYISGHPGVMSIDESSTSSLVIPTNNVNHYSGYVFTDTIMVDGMGYSWASGAAGTHTGMPTFDGTSTMTGNNGSGKAIIEMVTISNNNYLTSLGGNIGSLTETFRPDKYEYNLVIDKYEQKVTLTATASDPDATITGLREYTLASGETKDAQIIVTAPSGENRTYILHVTRATLAEGEHNSKLVDLSVNGYRLDKIFTSLTETYDIKISQNVYDVVVNATAYDPTATITITGNRYMNNDTGRITIKVTAEGVSPTTYYIYYTKVNYADATGEYGYSGTYETFTADYDGKYIVQLWGAQGGTSMDTGSYTGSNSYVGGLGGYTYGEINLMEGDKLYVFVGGKGANAVKKGDAAGGWNGGGNGTSDHSDDESAGAGGGATDIRLVPTSSPNIWNETASLVSRIMVAGGGGGSAYGARGGHAGGLTGGKAYYAGSATQTSGNAFGVGGNGIYTNTNVEVGGGGGGYYGAYAKSSGTKDVYKAAGGGGSSYISGYEGSVAIISSESITPRYDSQNAICADGTTDVTCSYHYSGVKFDNPVMISGNNLMPNYTNTDRVTGNSNNGYAKITLQDVKSQNAYLENLTVTESNYSDENIVDMDFDPLVNNYNITISKYTRTFTVAAELSDANATVTGTGKYNIEPGETITVEVEVTAPDGNKNKYTIIATRETNEGHTTLLKNLQIDRYDLNEDFYANKTNYTVNIFDVEIDLVVNSFKFDNDATVTVTGNRYISNNTGVVTVTVKHDPVDGETIADTVYTIAYTKITPSMTPVEFTYTGEYQKWTTPFAAKYRIEAYGASGGGGSVNAHTTASAGGLGGYAAGTYKILKGKDLYIYVGGQGTYAANAQGGWNGGGNAGTSASGSGGGATDVRLTPTSAKNIWNEDASLYSRFIVAGGAGGADNSGGTINGSEDGSGGSGSGLSGQGAWYNGSYLATYGGTQVDGYALGAGASATASTDTGGAGGGYYGGYATNYSNGGAGAGSSYLKGYPGADTTYVSYQQGVEYVDGEFREAQRNGNGLVRITMLGIISDNIYLDSLAVNTDITGNTNLINEVYDPLKGVYTANLDKYSELFFVNGVLSDASSTVVGLGEYHIAPGETREITVIVTAESGNTKTYNITVTRAAFAEGEHSSKLSSLSERTFRLKENFYSTKTEYTMNVYSNEYDTDWIYTTYDPEATVVVSGDKYIKRSPGTITITVSAPECEDTVYTIVYTKVYTEEPSKNAYLSSLASSSSPLVPEFSPTTLEYDVYLTSYTSGTRITGTVDDALALADGLNQNYLVNPDSTRDVTIRVTSDYGNYKDYTIHIHRAAFDSSNENTLLKTLVVRGYETDIDFQSETYEYNLTIPKGEIDLDFDYTTYFSGVDVSVEGNKHLTSDTGDITITTSKSGLADTVYTIHYTKHSSYSNDFDYTGNYQTFTAPYTGKYTFELWGAGAGTSMDTGKLTNTYSRPGGAGGYTKGTIELQKGETVYIYVGGRGKDAIIGDAAGGFNGGGKSVYDHSDDESAGSGGGATDIRLIPGVWNYNKSLASRIMVAGGGGGAAYNHAGGYAGGLTGEKANYAGSATQTSGYAFGIGQDAVFKNTNVEIGGGGGGYWGGYTEGGVDGTYQSSGGGGSSYISGYTGSVAIKAINDTTPRLDSNDELCINGTEDVTCSYHYSGKIFTNTEMLAGNEVQPTHDKTSYQTGNTTNGFARVAMELSQDTYLNSLSTDYGTFDVTFDPLHLNYTLHLSEYESYFNLTGTLSNPNATVTGINRLYEVELGATNVLIPIIVTAPNGDTKTYTVTVNRDNYTESHSTKLKALSVRGYESALNPSFIPIRTNYSITVDDSEAEGYISYETFDPTATVVVTGEGRINESGAFTITVSASGCTDTVYTISYVRNSTPEGTEFEFNYTGGYQEFIVPTTGFYRIETWGAQGGGRNTTGNTNAGYGGTGGYSSGVIKLYKDTKLYVYVGGQGGFSETGLASGGFNGGGYAFATDSGEPAAGGGGATDVRTIAGDLYTRFIVAGGGGGGGEDNEDGGVGGGSTGGRVSSSCSSNATATAGYCGAVFGIGASTAYDGGAGGGGWYGGGTYNGSQDIPFENNVNDTNGGNGGSGFVLSASTATSVPTNYKLNSTWHMTEATYIMGNAKMPSHDHNDIMYGNTGNGYALFTLLSKTSKDNYLAALTTDYGTFNKTFTPEDETYTLTLDSYTPQFTLSGRASDANALVTGFDTYLIEPGETKNVEISVTSTSGDTRRYMITATRAAFTDAHSTLLKSLRLNEGLENEIIPSFNSGVLTYTVKFYENVTDVDVITETYDTCSDVEVKITGNRHLSDSGAITIVVSHKGSPASTTYTINYTRDKSLDDYVPGDDDVVTNYSYTGEYKTFIAPTNGKYIIELWGAEGNAPTGGRTYGGKGAYTYGILELAKNEKIYIYVGQNRTDRTASWNAGSTGGSSSNTTNGGAANGYGGGGATDVRLVPTSALTTWNEAASINSRIMVAGGGGGASNYAYPAYGGAAGGLTGYPGHNGKYPNVGIINTPPTGGTQTGGGTSTNAPAGVTKYVGTVGSFGVGGNGHSSWGGAGGGGYWGGAGAGYTDSSVDSGAGGSSYISGYTGSVAIKSASDRTPREGASGDVCANGTEDITCSYHYSGKIFTNTLMLSGEDYLPTKDKTSLQYGNSGSGYARITQILKDKDNYLQTLTSTHGTFDKTFDPLIDEYTLTLDQYDPSFTLDGTVSQADASVAGLGYYEIEDGDSYDISIIVTSESGDSKTYTIHVQRNGFSGEHSTKLRSLRLLDNEAINGRYGLNEEFNSQRYSYTTDLYSNVTDLTILAVPYDPTAEIEIIGNLYITTTSGTITVRVTAEGVASTDYVIAFNKQIVEGAGDVKKYSYTGSYNTFTALVTGNYKVQLWGASGGIAMTDSVLKNAGGAGAYTEGIIKLDQGTKLYVYVGQKGYNGRANCKYCGGYGGWNGGAKGGDDSNHDSAPDEGGGGGGATDVRLVPTSAATTWNEQASLVSRIMVAGAGGGSTYGSVGNPGGAWVFNNPSYAWNFGYGRAGYAATGGGQGGGGGYWGGNSAQSDNGIGYGGSSYVSGHTGQIAITSATDLTARLNSNGAVCAIGTTDQLCSVHYSGYQFTDTVMKAGNQVMPNTAGTGTMTGNAAANGYAIITPLFYSRDNYLTDITVSTVEEHTFNQHVNTSVLTFDPLVFEYDVEMDRYDEWITIGATASDPTKATIEGAGEYRVPDEGGNLDIVLKVTAESGEYKEYTIHVHRKDFENHHSTKLKDLDIVGYEDVISPRFHSHETDYELSISSSFIDLLLHVVPYDEAASYVITTDNEENRVDGDNIYYIKSRTGTIYITVTLPDAYVDPTNENTAPTTYTIIYVKSITSDGTFSYTGNYQTWTAQSDGYYFFEAWGARGGQGRENNKLVDPGGLGAYTAGTLYVRKGETFYIYVGGAGTHAVKSGYAAGGWNGGGRGDYDHADDDAAGAGGGATDFRTVAGAWDNFDSLKSRIMVAAGGAGSPAWSSTPSGGGLYDAGGNASPIASQTGGYAFGYGAPGTYRSSNTDEAGGGGGYYGGGVTSGTTRRQGAGSSFISGHAGADAIAEESVSGGIIHTGQPNHYSGYVFTDTIMIDGYGYNWTNVREGYVGMPNGSHTSTMTGNNGNGYAKITPLNRDNYLTELNVRVSDSFNTDTFNNLTDANYTPEFDKFTYTYYLTLPDHVTELTLSARASNDSATIEGLGTFKVIAGTHPYEVNVTSESGEVKTYTIIVTRPASDDANALDISVTGFVESLCKPFAAQNYCKLTPLEFNENTYEYALTVPAGIRDLEWTATKRHEYQTIIGDGVTRLRGGANTITIEVTSESGNVIHEYTYHVYRDMTGDNYIDTLRVITPNIDINFDYLLSEYSFRIDNEYTELELEVILDDPEATYEIIGNENFEVGPNIVEILVTAKNGEKRSYILEVYRLANANKLLSELHVKNGTTELELNPAFQDITTSYQLNVPNDVTSVNVTAVAAYNKTTISGTGTKALNTGLNQINVITTAENGETETYTIIVNRAKSDNAYLTILKALEGNFNETYVKTNNDYTMTVNPYTKKINLNIVPEEPNATYKVTGNENFKVGANLVKVIVTAENGNTNTYNITVTKEGSNINTLATLTTNRGEVEPTFTPGNNTYSITVPNNIQNITISGTMTDTLSKVVGFGTYRLTTGINPIEITVTSETGIPNTYIVNVLREYNSNNYLSSLKVNGTMVSGFGKEVLEYEMNVPFETETINVTATPEVSTTTVSGTGSIPLTVGENFIYVIARAEDHSTRTYQIKVIRDRSNNTNLADLFIRESRIKPTFDPMTISYTAKVMNDLTAVTIIATPVDANATVEIIGPYNNLAVGDNEIIVRVTAPDGETTKDYTVNVIRLDEDGPKLYLSTLEVSDCTLEFNKTTPYYHCSVPNEVEQVTISATVEEEEGVSASLTGIGTFDLIVGRNNFPIVITETNEGYERVYNVEIERLKNTESRLRNIVVSNHEFTPEFDKDVTEYTLETESYDLEILYEKLHPNQSVVITGNHDLELGENTVTVTVTSEDGAHHTTYTFTVTRNVRNNNFLSELWVEDETITPEFNPMVSNYKLTVPYETTTAIIHATAEDRNATVEGDGMKTLLVGPNTFTIRVRAENNEVRDYRIIITRLASPNNYLSSLSVEGEEISPTFDRNNFQYTLAVPYETESIVVNATAEDEDATIIGTGTVNLKQGVNNVDVYVTAANGNVRTYTIKVTRKDPITAKLLNIEVENYTLDPLFTPDNPLYSVTVDYETTKLNFIITKMDPYSTYEIEGNRNLKIGLNDVYINVTSSNRIDTFQYHVIVNRQSYSNTFLSSLTVSQGELTPSFVKTTLTYNVEVPNSVTMINIDGSPDYPLSTVSGLGNYSLAVGNNPIKVTVTSPSGIKRIYTVNVSRKKSSNANVTSITANIGTLEKEDDYTYTLYVPKYTTNIGKSNFRVVTEDPAATVSMPTTIDLKQTTAYPIRVTSPDGTRTKEYTVNVVFDLSHDATLAMLIPSVGELNPEFDRLHNNYRIDLFDDVDEIYFDLYLNEVEATLLNRSLTFQLTELETTARIMIQAEDGTVNTYNVLIAKSKTKQQYLNNIEVTGVHEIDPTVEIPSFRQKTLEYEFDVPYEVESIGFNITKKHPAQVVKVYKEGTLQNGNSYSLRQGVNTFRIDVTNSLNETVSYTYVVNRLKSTNANLRELGLSTPSVVFSDFDKDTLTYNVQISNTYESVVVRAIPEVEGSYVEVNGATNIEEGVERRIVVTVVAQDEITTKEYYINVLRVPAVDNLIKTITVSAYGNIKELTPKFRPGNEDYYIKVASTIDTISIDAIPNAPTTVITANKDLTTTTSGVSTIYKMEPSLVVGDNVLKFYSTADFEGQSYTKTYTITVNRVSARNALLENLIVRNGILVEDFRSDLDSYHVEVANGVTALDFTAIPEDDAATVTITGNSDFVYGEDNLITILVRSADGEASKRYYIHVNMAGDSNNYLADLKVDDVTVAGFNKYIEEYEMRVENSVESVTITGIPEKNTTTVPGNGVYTLDVGENTINLEVFAQDGSKKTYTIHINRDENAYLDNIVYTIKSREDEESRSYYLEGFNREKYDYELTVENDIDKINFIALASDILNAQITGQGEYDLQVGENPVYIVVRNGETRKVYTIIVNRKGSSNTNLLYLTSSDGDLIPEYSNSEDEYVIHIPNYKTKLALSYEVEYNATVEVINNNLSGDMTIVTVRVTAEDGTIRDIHIKVYLEDGSYFNSRLANLEVQEGTLSPKFDPNTYAYSVTVSQDDEFAHIIAIPEESTSIVIGDGAQALVLGRNEKAVIVTAPDGTTTTYTIVIFRKDASNADLTGLYTDIGELDPAFNPKVYHYTIDVPEETRKVHLTAVAYAEKTIVGDGDVILGKGTTTRNIVVTSESGVTNTYVVDINRALSTNHDITNITESTGKMSPLYNADVLEYGLTVGDRSTINNTYVIADKITFNVTTASELAEVYYIVGDAEETLNNVVNLEYGDNEVYIFARSEDGNESEHYRFIIHRIHDLTDITVPGDATGPAMLDGSPNHISVQPGGTFDLLSEITYTPEDADFKDLSFTSNNTAVVTVDSDGIITAKDVLDKSTTITVRSNKYPSIVKTVNVTVEITLITSDVYQIEREKTGYEPFITEIDIKTPLSTFLNNLDNDIRFLHIYDENGTEITDMTRYSGTKMKVALENNGHTYDYLYLVVNADVNGDGYANVQDTTLISNHINKKITLAGVQYLAADVNHDGFVNVQDSTLISNYINKKRDTFLGL